MAANINTSTLKLVSIFTASLLLIVVGQFATFGGWFVTAFIVLAFGICMASMSMLFWRCIARINGLHLRRYQRTLESRRDFK